MSIAGLAIIDGLASIDRLSLVVRLGGGLGSINRLGGIVNLGSKSVVALGVVDRLGDAMLRGVARLETIHGLEAVASLARVVGTRGRDLVDVMGNMGTRTIGVERGLGLMVVVCDIAGRGAVAVTVKLGTVVALGAFSMASSVVDTALVAITARVEAVAVSGGRIVDYVYFTGGLLVGGICSLAAICVGVEQRVGFREIRHCDGVDG